MENISWEKPPVIRQRLIQKCCIVGALLLLGLGAISNMVVQCAQYRDVRSRAVRLDAVVSQVKEGKDVDGYDEYAVYVTYEYNGEQYTKHHMTSSHDSWMGRIGESITITINPDRPTQELDEVSGNAFWCAFFGMPALSLGIALCFRMRCRLSWVEMYGLRSYAIRQDLKISYRMGRRQPFLLSLAVGYIASGLYLVDVESAGVGMVMLGCMVLVLFCIFRFLPLFRIDYSPEEPYRMYVNTVLDKKTELDSEGDKEYYLMVKGERDSRWSRCTESDYKQLPVGAQITEIVCGSIHMRYWYDNENQSYWTL